MAARVQDVLWLSGVLIVTAACLWYVRGALRDGDTLLAWAGGLAAAGFALAALLYWWLVWGS